MTQKELFNIARKEVKAWPTIPRGLVMAILFAFIHRITIGESVDDTFFRKSKPKSP